jgi:uncharacterized membrane protein (UPF0127 family)
MKLSKIIKFLIILLFIFIILFFYFSSNKNSSLISYRINNKIYKLLTAKNTLEWTKGLMFYKSKNDLKGADGMIFIFPDKEVRSFWNENTYLDLDLYWLDDDKIVGKGFLPAILKSKTTVTISSPIEVNRVVEVVR